MRRCCDPLSLCACCLRPVRRQATGRLMSGCGMGGLLNHTLLYHYRILRHIRNIALPQLTVFIFLFVSRLCILAEEETWLLSSVQSSLFSFSVRRSFILNNSGGTASTLKAASDGRPSSCWRHRQTVIGSLRRQGHASSVNTVWSTTYRFQPAHRFLPFGSSMVYAATF